MRRDKFILPLLLLCFCFCTGSLSNPVPEKATVVDISSYKGYIDTTTSASGESLARWSISANLHQMYQNATNDYTVLKLVNIKTSLFNGYRRNLHDADEIDIPEEAKILEQPFALKWEMGEVAITRLFFKPNEPLWSVNLKRGIANLLEFEYEKPRLTSDGEIAHVEQPPYTYYENTIYGQCKVGYSRKSASVQDGIVYEKKMDNLNCKQQAIKHLTNTIRAPGVKDLFDILNYNQTKLLTLKKKKDGNFKIEKIESKASLLYKTSPSAAYTLQVDQEYSLTYKDTHELEEPIDLSQFSDEREYTYEFGDDPTAGRHIYEKDTAKLTKQFFEQYDEFFQSFQYSPVEHNARSSDLVYDIYNALSNLNFDGFKSIEKYMADKENLGNNYVDFDYGNLYLSMLSYVGTNATVEYLTKFYKSNKVNADAEYAARMMVIFPQHIQEPSDDKLVEMEGLMNNPNAQQKITKHAAVFGFACAVATSCRKNAISKKYKHKYIDMFHSKYIDGETYEEKMVYILGLVNMAECLDFDFINSITTNSTESGELRALALNGFKKYLQNYKNTVYDTYWPLVQKKSEPFEVRVAALELLLSTHLREDQFNTIVQKYSDDLNEPEDKQLANYLLTSLHSIQNTTGYYDPLGVLASEAVKSANIYRFPRTWATGKYRLSYTDSVPNAGAAVEARLITDINTNLINTFEISFNSFGNSFDFGTYTLHLKLNGFYDEVFVNKFLKRYSEASLPQLLKLLKDNDFIVKSFTPEGHVDVVLFANNIAIYATHWDSFDQDDTLRLIEELGEFIFASKYFTMPVNDYIHIPSDGGTPIIISNYMIDISKQERGGPNDKSFGYRSLWSYQTWIEAYNPLADANIANYKYYNDEKSFKLNVTWNKRFPPSLTWINENNTYSQIWDNNMGVTVEEESLKKYCKKCEIDNKVETDNYSSWTNNWEPFGVHFDVESYANEKNNYHAKVFRELWTENLHRYNVDALPYAGPFLLAADLSSYKFWLRSDLTKGSIRSRSLNGFDKVTETTLNIEHNGYTHTDFKAESSTEIKSDVTVKTLEDEVLSFVNLTVAYVWYPDFVEENTTKQTGIKLTSFNLVYKPSDTNSSFKICGRGETNFPTLRDDRLSIKPYEDTVGESVFMFAENVDDFEDCVPKYTYTFKEIYSSIDKRSDANGKVSKNFEKCIADSKDLKYTAPTKECKAVSNKLTEYGNYQVYCTAIKHFDDHNETIYNNKNPLFEYSRTAEDKVLVSARGLTNFIKVGDSDTFSHEFYYPHMTVNPLWLSYNTDETANPEYAHSTCTITPSTIEKFSGKFVPNQRKEWFAFGECLNTSRAGLNGHTIDDKHVGFTFYTEDAAVVATVKNGHLDVTVNEKQVTEYYEDYNMYLLIRFLSDNVIYISAFNLEIYYNTEYVFIRTNTMYPKMVCGLCN